MFFCLITIIVLSLTTCGNTDPISISVTEMLGVLHRIEKDWNLLTSEISNLISLYQVCLEQHNERIPINNIIEKQDSFLNLFNHAITSKQLRLLKGALSKHSGDSYIAEEALMRRLSNLYTDITNKDDRSVLNLVYLTKFEKCNAEFKNLYKKKIESRLKLFRKQLERLTSSKMLQKSKAREAKLVEAVSVDLKHKLKTLVYSNKIQKHNKDIHGKKKALDGRSKRKRRISEVAGLVEDYLDGDSGIDSDSDFDD